MKQSQAREHRRTLETLVVAQARVLTNPATAKPCKPSRLSAQTVAYQFSRRMIMRPMEGPKLLEPLQVD